MFGKATLLLAILLLAVRVPAAEATVPLREQLQLRNQLFAEALVGEDIAKVMDHYREGAMLMPEHSTARHGKPAIEDFYRQWFDKSQTGSLRKTAHEVLDYGDYAVETGSFVQTFTKPGASPYDYAGKYMTLWAIDGAQPRILSELWGADAPFDDAALPAIEDSTPFPRGSFSGDAKVAEEIRGRNALIDRLVTERKGGEHAALFLPDAVYMTYYTPMLVGIAPIRDYFIEHEKPGDVVIESLELSTGDIIPMDGGKLQLEQGFYTVAWRAGNDGGTITGKSLNLWKRDKHGTLMLYRQAVNHD